MTLACTPRLRKTLLASLIGAALAPATAWPLELAQAPPGTTSPYIAPNIILTLDDSPMMGNKDYNMHLNGASVTRMQILQNALKNVFSDETLIPNEYIRMAWQTVGNCSRAGLYEMRVMDSEHRTRFLNYANNFRACSDSQITSVDLRGAMRSADNYMRRARLESEALASPWSFIPSREINPVLPCRRNYHLIISSRVWWKGEESGTNPQNYDASRRIFPDGTIYEFSNIGTSFNKIYRGFEKATMMSDLALHSWANPFLHNPPKIKPSADYQRAPAKETFRNRKTGESITLPKYWNPRYNPATWPHMVTFTIGLGTNYAIPKFSPKPSTMMPYGFDGRFAELALGSDRWSAWDPGQWQSNRGDLGHDMWHAAINGRGRFYAVENGDDLETALRLAVKQITKPDIPPNTASSAATGSNISRSNVARYTAHYDRTQSWKGWITADVLKTDGNTEEAWDKESTADKLDALVNVDDRLILAWSDSQAAAVPFRWADDESRLSTAQKAWLQQDASGQDEGADKGRLRLAYLRGDRSTEGREESNEFPAERPFRERQSRQGDIINSEVWHVGTPASDHALPGYTAFVTSQAQRLPMLYVGGNDGMLHGFSANDGTEKLAYVPRGVLPALGRLTDPGYNDNHHYYVDGSPMSGDADLGTASSPNWRTLLLGTLGAGGKGYFVLDVTDPGSFSERSATSLALMDKTRHARETVASVATCEDSSITAISQKEDCLAAADMGHIFAKPIMDDAHPQRNTQIARLNNNRWAAVLGNGYNSRSGRPVLLVQYLDGNKELLRLVATGTTASGQANTTDNGLSAPRLVDINGDGRPDVAYAGDLQGNLWKFLLADSSDSNWGVAQWGSHANTTTNHTTTGTPLFTARGGRQATPNQRTLAQPITAAPTVRANDRTRVVTQNNQSSTVHVGGMMVAFGTGRNVTVDDPGSTDVQTLYSVLDNTRYQLVGDDRKRVAVCASRTAPCDKLLASDADLPAPVTQQNLAQQKIRQRSVGSRGSRIFWRFDTSSTAVNWSQHKGWFLDLPLDGERLLKPMGFFDGSNLLAAYSQVPVRPAVLGHREPPTSCDDTPVNDERQYLTLINIMDGKRPSVQIIDTTGDGKYSTTGDGEASRMSVSKGSQTLVKKGPQIIQHGADGRQDAFATMPEQALRPSWRQLR